jgi:hypothetical protein
MMAVLIIGFVCWHIIDAVQRQTKTSFIAMVFFFVVLSIIHAAPGFISIYKESSNNPELKKHYNHAVIYASTGLLSLLTLLFIFWNFYQLF